MSLSLVNNKYKITRRIGGGSFGEIYLGIGPSGEHVAVKFEKQLSRCPQLRHEYKVYREITMCHGFCNVYYFGMQETYNVMVMDLLGPSLEDLFNKCNRKFSLKTVLQLADQMLERVDTLHSRYLIHRDIKPANFVMGRGENANIVYCVDFGLSKRYCHPKTLQHIPYRDGRSLTGTPRYASINNHRGIDQSRRDDLESIAYVLIYFLKGTLPWQGLRAANPQKKYHLIQECKEQTNFSQLCAGCPAIFGDFLEYSRHLKYDSKPDIQLFRKKFKDLYDSQGYSGYVGKLWDWDTDESELPSERLTNSARDLEIPHHQTNNNNNNTNNNNNNNNTPINNNSITNSNNNISNIGESKVQQTNRPTSAKYVSQESNPQKWGVPGKGIAGGVIRHNGELPLSNPEINISREKPPNRNSGSFKRDGAIVDENELRRRPHTANYNGRTAPEIDNGQVILDNRGMIPHRQLPDSIDPVIVSAPGVFSHSQPQIVPAPRSLHRPYSHHSSAEIVPTHSAINTQYSGSRQNETSGRPKSAGVAISNNNIETPTTSNNNPNTQTSGNPMSYGSIKSRFLSTSKTKPKFFGLSR